MSKALDNLVLDSSVSTVKSLTISKILESHLIDDDTEIFVRGRGFHPFAHGKWYSDGVFRYLGVNLESFTLQDDNKLYADLI